MKTKLIILTILAAFNCAAGEPFSITFMAGLGQRSVAAPIGATVFLGFVNGGNITPRNLIELGRTQVREIAGEPGRFAATVSVPEFYAGRKLWWVIVDADAQGASLRDVWDRSSMAGMFSATNWIVPSADTPWWERSIIIHSSEVNEVVMGSVTNEQLTLAPTTEGKRFTVTVLRFTDLTHPEQAEAVATAQFTEPPGSLRAFFRLAIREEK